MYAIVDIETTGGYADNHRITEIAIYHHDGVEITNYFYTLINPGRRIPYFITGLTGITSDMVSGAPAFEEVAETILRLVEDRIFVAHNAHFDYSFLKKEFEQAGITWQSKKLCTVRLSRKILPGLRSYSLGSLAASLGIKITNRHRAGGDAEATAKIFSGLLQRDTEGYIGKLLKRNSGETILPPNLPKEEYDNLPTKAGVYYFRNARGQVIYVGKANNIKQRVAGHFTGDAREWSRSKIRNEIHHITWELTGNELISLILESQEIRMLWPKYNRAQKYIADEWGIYTYEDQKGYHRFSVNQVTRGAKPLIRFSTKGDAWNFLWEKVHAFKLCPKLSGLQVNKGPCSSLYAGACKGACSGNEKPATYNRRTAKAIKSFGENGASVVVVGKGRNPKENAVVLVQKGKFAGYGFVNKKLKLKSVRSVRRYMNYMTNGVETPTVQNIVNSYLLNPRGLKVLVIG